MSIADLRKEYALAGLRRKDLGPDPIPQSAQWLDEAIRAGALEPTAMTLATAGRDGRPSSRTVLLKGIDARGYVFFTNYSSRKGRELDENPRASLTLYWRELERQICICGTASKLPAKESATYFQSRPFASRLAAWVSKQTEVIVDRAALEAKLSEISGQYKDQQVPLPPWWGGYVIAPETVEFWQGRPSRLHDRFRYRREKETWILERLSP